jgi:hypothetical protein
MQHKLRVFAFILLFINGIGAIWGGAGLIYDPTGEFMQMPLDFLKYSPFSTYLIPGILLLLFNGLLSTSFAIMGLRKHKHFAYMAIAQGLVLAIWLTVQIIMIRLFYPPLHLTFYLFALGMILFGGVLARYR